MQNGFTKIVKNIFKHENNSVCPAVRQSLNTNSLGSAFEPFRRGVEGGSRHLLFCGMSGDTVKTLAAFKKLNALNFTLLSDETGSVAGMFGVPTKPGGTVTQKI